MENKKTALVFGASGLVGSALLDQLINDPEYSSVKVFVRSPIEKLKEKVEIIISNLKDVKKIETCIQGDVVFCCLGTTIKKAKSKEGFAAVDLHLPIAIAQIARKNNVNSFVVVSALGANAASSNFYLSVKGKMESAVSKLGFVTCVILRPSLLLGDRKEFRLGEKIGEAVSKIFAPIMVGPIKKYAPVQAASVAMAMRKNAYLTGNRIIESDQINKL